jgi:alginate O-acetyltransferase complex protein AlgI
MIFNSVTYILFLLIVVCLYWMLPLKQGRLMLLVTSLLFYGFWRFEFLPLLLAAAVLDYWCSIQIEKQEEHKKRVAFLVLSLSINLGILFYFKYLLFFAENVVWALNLFGCEIAVPHLNIILPLGISFYTFETVSYTVDVYRKHIKAERNFLSYATFLVYFPHLIAGPVLRAAEILPQLKTKKKFDTSFIVAGTKRVIQGLFLKVALADNIAPYVDNGFLLQTSSLSALDVLTLAFMFGMQIYFDFCAYSHIAIGSAKMMGIDFPENFNFPYVASSFKEFWQRWHISLSSWIRDYLYLPLLKTKVVNDAAIGIGSSLEATDQKRNRNVVLFMTWTIMGLWHGANWTFIFWGVYHASFIFIERMLMKYRANKSTSAVRQGLGWLIVVPIIMLSWIPFRATDMHMVMDMYAKLAKPSAYMYLGMQEDIYIICALLFLLMILTYLYKRMLQPKVQTQKRLNSVLTVAAYTVMIILVFTFLRPISQFIYFQF